MKKYIIIIPLVALLFNTPFVEANETETSITLDDYQNGLAKEWQEKVFKGHTHYEASQKDGQPCIAAVSKASASGLFYEISFDPDTMPVLIWQWQIDDVIAKGDATQKSGDDYAARVYVVFPNLFFWRTRALNYVWDNKLPKETFIANAYTKSAMMIIVESGPQNKGKWLKEERDIQKDYLKAFGESPPKVGAIAIMTDTDDTGETAKAWYGPIRIGKRAGE